MSRPPPPKASFAEVMKANRRLKAENKEKERQLQEAQRQNAARSQRIDAEVEAARIAALAAAQAERDELARREKQVALDRRRFELEKERIKAEDERVRRERDAQLRAVARAHAVQRSQLALMIEERRLVEGGATATVTTTLRGAFVDEGSGSGTGRLALTPEVSVRRAAVGVQETNRLLQQTPGDVEAILGVTNAARYYGLLAPAAAAGQPGLQSSSARQHRASPSTPSPRTERTRTEPFASSRTAA
ncbi:hypothetical protein DFJ73DRAFT_962829 [Zopfochytrium polystomum]|nr:hypothetical protein DFJ73DRAFT_962829 [Zopfochytrium polystomum]